MKLRHITFLILVTAVVASAQTANFPGLSAQHRKTLTNAKRYTAIPLPTWVPEGFAVEKVISKLGPRARAEGEELVIVYARKLPNGKMQRFSIEAGLGGIGGVPYDVTHTLTTPVGKVELMYEPPDLDDSSKKIKNFAITEWFNVGKTAFHYLGRYGDPEEKDPNLLVVSLADTEKILKSLKRF